MQTPVEIDFQGMDARPDVRASIEQARGRSWSSATAASRLAGWC